MKIETARDKIEDAYVGLGIAPPQGESLDRIAQRVVDYHESRKPKPQPPLNVRPMIAFVVGLAMLTSPVKGQSRIENATRPLAPLTIQLDGIPTSALVTMLLRDVMGVPYVIAPDVLSDRRPTSVRLVIPRNDVPARVVAYLRRAGFSVELQGGTVYVGRAGTRYSAPLGLQNPSTPWGSPLSAERGFSPQNPVASSNHQAENDGYAPASRGAPKTDEPDGELLAYLPAHRSPDYLSSVIAPLVSGLSLGARSEPKADTGSASIASENGPDVLVFSGSPSALDRARKLIIALDRPRPMVAVKAVVMQVASVQARGSALSILANLAGGKIKGGSFGGEAVGSQFLRIGTGALSAMLSVVREDSRFKVVASPNLAALSGAVATINAGSQVPTVGAVTIAEGGTPVRSVVYRDSGITLTVRPTVRGELIEMDVKQERSNFVRTTTGVEDSPTLQKASASASVTLKSGESVILAGLNEENDEARREGLFGGLLGVRAKDKSSSELLVVIQAEIIAAPVVAAGVFLDLGEALDPLAPDTITPSPRPKGERPRRFGPEDRLTAPDGAPAGKETASRERADRSERSERGPHRLAQFAGPITMRIFPKNGNRAS